LRRSRGASADWTRPVGRRRDFASLSIDVKTMTVQVHTRPVDDRYELIVVMRDGEVLRPTQLPGVSLAIADMPR
jgi:hypothetical protein